MRNRNELNELFRRNQYKLRERPDPRIWNRLEQRLDNKPHRSVGTWVSQWSMAAAILILIGVAFVLLQIVETPSRQAQASANPQPIEVEDLPVAVQNPVLLEQSVQLRREYERSNPIVEGEGKGRLVLNYPGKPTSSLPAKPGRRI
jgi:hypothetical protein